MKKGRCRNTVFAREERSRKDDEGKSSSAQAQTGEGKNITNLDTTQHNRKKKKMACVGGDRVQSDRLRGR